ncbi:MAG: hypothetical protein KIT18_00865 [Burkholderiales bacterium]|nr:hypothetical protein [Burkholderiales bacterium]
MTLHGHQSAGGGAATTTTSTAVAARAGVSTGGVRAAFGTPVAPSAPGGTLYLGRGGSAVLLLGVLVAGAVDMAGSWLRGAPAPGPAPREAISETCSCYGWKPPAAPHDASELEYAPRVPDQDQDRQE